MDPYTHAFKRYADRRAKPEDKPYTLGDGQGLSLLIEPNGSRSWRFGYRYAGKPKMISLGVYPTITLADARSLRDEARKLVAEGKNPSEVRKEQKLALQTESENAFEKIARAWHQLKSDKWSAGYVSDIMEAFKNDIFPYVGTRPVGEIKPLELLNVLRKIEERGALEKCAKCDSVGPKFFTTQLQRAGRSTILRLISPVPSKCINPIISRS